MEPVATKPVAIGIDIGQQRDPTAIVVVEASERDSGRMRHVDAHTTLDGSHEQAYDTPIMETVFEVRSIAALPLGMSYPEVAQRVASLVCNPQIIYRERVVRVDVTGVGRPVFEMIEEAIRAQPFGSRVALRPITFTHGDRYDWARGVLGKAYLVSRLQALLQSKRLKLPPHHAEAEALARELKDYEIHVDRNANDTYGAFKVGTHDDLATALGLAVIEEPDAHSITQGPRLYQS